MVTFPVTQVFLQHAWNINIFELHSTGTWQGSSAQSKTLYTTEPPKPWVKLLWMLIMTANCKSITTKITANVCQTSLFSLVSQMNCTQLDGNSKVKILATKNFNTKLNLCFIYNWHWTRLPKTIWRMHDITSNSSINLTTFRQNLKHRKGYSDSRHNTCWNKPINMMKDHFWNHLLKLFVEQIMLELNNSKLMAK